MSLQVLRSKMRFGSRITNALMPSMEKYGGRFVARGGPIHVLEGEWPRERLIIAEFPSMERAQQWWVSLEYAEPKALRQATADSELVIVQGVEPIDHRVI